MQTLDAIEDGILSPVPQGTDGVSHAPKLEPRGRPGALDAPAARRRPARPRAARRRPAPGRRCPTAHVWVSDPSSTAPDVTDLAPGELRAGKRDVLVGTAGHAVRLGYVTPQGKRPMAAADWARGARLDGHDRARRCGMSADDRRDATGRSAGRRAPGPDPAVVVGTVAAPQGQRRGTDRGVRRAARGRRHDAYANLVLPPLLRERRIDRRDAAFATELAYGHAAPAGTLRRGHRACVDRPTDKVDPPVLDVLRLGAHQLLGMRVPAHAAVSETVELARERVGHRARPSSSTRSCAAIGREPLDAGAERLRRTADAGRHLAARAQPSRAGSSGRCGTRSSGTAAGRRDRGRCSPPTTSPPHVTLVARPGLADVDELLADADRSARGALAPPRCVLAGGDPAALPSRARRPRRGAGRGQPARRARAGRASRSRAATSAGSTCAPGPAARRRCWRRSRRSAVRAVVANELQPHRAALVRAGAAGRPGRRGRGRAHRATVARSGAGADAFDRVLVDAPCTGLGALRRRPEARWRRSPADLAALARCSASCCGAALRRGAARRRRRLRDLLAAPGRDPGRGGRRRAASRAGSTSSRSTRRRPCGPSLPGVRRRPGRRPARRAAVAAPARHRRDVPGPAASAADDDAADYGCVRLRAMGIQIPRASCRPTSSNLAGEVSRRSRTPTGCTST